ncbi:MAG TPA: DegQ family serine endoprotease [Burkholderiales bacterium]|nr:DegQ family serine endoprotease [Burkholderiales bacterium]
MQPAKATCAWIAAASIVALSAGCDPKAPKIQASRAPAVAAPPAVSSAANVEPHALPDFSALVEAVAPAIVNIKAISEVDAAATAGNVPVPKDDPLYEFFRRFGAPEAKHEPMQGLGSGLIVTADGHILTNAHVVQDATDVTVKLTDRREFKAKVIGADRRSDIAVLKIEASGLPIVKIGDPDKIKVGEWVAAIGAPFGLENSVTSGIVSAKSRTLPDSNYVPFIQTDVAVNPGSSGGPLLNLQGEVIGINSQIYSRTGGYMGLSFAIPIDVAKKVEKDLLEHGRVSRGRLGIGIQTVDQALAKSFHLDEPAGVIVNGVEQGGPADKAGVKPGDIVLRFAGKDVGRPNDLPTLVAETKPGTKTNLEVWRKGGRKTLAVTVGELPDDGVATAKKPSAPTESGDPAGLAVRPLTPEERDQVKTEGGVMVENAEGAGARAGIQPGDIILRVNEKPVENIGELRREISGSGEVVALLVQRDNKRVYVAVTPG